MREITIYGRGNMLKKKVNGSWSNISAVKRKTNGSWSDCTSVKKKYNGSWTKVWPSSTFFLGTKKFSESNYGQLAELYWTYEVFKTVSTRMDGEIFQMSAKGTGANAPSKGGIAYGDILVRLESEPFYLYIDQEIVESNKATVEAILFIQTSGDYDYYIVRRYAFTSSRQIQSFYIPSISGQFGIYVYLYFYISSNEFTSGSSSIPSATARIYGMWTDTTRYDLSY